MEKVIIQIEFQDEMPFDQLLIYLNEMNGKQDFIEAEELEIYHKEII